MKEEVERSTPRLSMLKMTPALSHEIFIMLHARLSCVATDTATAEFDWNICILDSAMQTHTRCSMLTTIKCHCGSDWICAAQEEGQAEVRQS